MLSISHQKSKRFIYFSITFVKVGSVSFYNNLPISRCSFNINLLYYFNFKII